MYSCVCTFTAVANEQLRGASPLDAALVQQYVNLADNEILPAACTWVYPTLGFMQYNKTVSSWCLLSYHQLYFCSALLT